MFLSACNAEGFNPNFPLHHTRHRMLIKAVQHHMGTSVLSRRLVTTYQATDIACISFDKPLYSTIGFTWLLGEQPSAIAQRFMDYVKSDFAKRYHLHEGRGGALRLPATES